MVWSPGIPPAQGPVENTHLATQSPQDPHVVEAVTDCPRQCSPWLKRLQGDHYNRRLAIGLGCSLGGQDCLRLLGSSTTGMAYKPPRNGSSSSGPETLPANCAGEAGHDTDRQRGCGVLHQLPGLVEVSISARKGATTALVGPVQGHDPESFLPPRAPECSSRPAVEGRPPSRRVAPTPSDSGPDLAAVQSGKGGPFCHRGQLSLSTVGLNARSTRATGNRRPQDALSLS